MGAPPSQCGPEGPPRLVCRCLGISSLRIAAAIRAEGLSEPEQVGQATGAGQGCGACISEIREILVRLRGGEVSPAEATRNRLLCRGETESRVEAVLWRGVAPELPQGARIDLLGVHGLRVDLHLAPDDGARRDQVTEALRKHVCEDLDVRFA